MGEALNMALRLAPTLADSISDARRIIAFRNHLVHGYADIASDIVWAVVEADLPALRSEVRALLGQAHDAVQ